MTKGEVAWVATGFLVGWGGYDIVRRLSLRLLRLLHG